MKTIDQTGVSEPSLPFPDESYPPDQLLALIAQQRIFKGLSQSHLGLLGASAKYIEFKAGEQILREGQPANRFYLVLEGKVVLEAEAEEQGMIPIQTLRPGDDLRGRDLVLQPRKIPRPTAAERLHEGEKGDPARGKGNRDTAMKYILGQPHDRHHWYRLNDENRNLPGDRPEAVPRFIRRDGPDHGRLCPAPQS